MLLSRLANFGSIFCQRPCSMPALSPSLPVRTRSIATRFAFCCALILPDSSGAGAWLNVTRDTTSGCFSANSSIMPLRQLQVAGDVEDRECDRLGRLLRDGPGRAGGLVAAGVGCAAGGDEGEQARTAGQ